MGLVYKTDINAPLKAVWDALTNPEVVKLYFFGTQLETSWMPGSPIAFRGEWEGVMYEDKGTVQSFEPQRRLAYTYWSPYSGKEDTPENYANIGFEVVGYEDGCYLTVTQDGFDSMELLEQSEKNWGMVFNKLKALLEVKNSTVPV
jgi:uncharacterized protein YndB with AHSA1/START domain